MKKLIFICTIFLNFQIIAQETKLNGSYWFTRNEIGKISFQVDTAEQNIPVDVYMNSKITILGRDTTSDLVYYKYWDYNPIYTAKYTKTSTGKDTVIYEEDENSMANIYNENIFSMPYKKFIDITAPLYKRYKGCQVGVYTIPFRLRGSGKDFDFESSLSLQSNIVFGFGNSYKSDSWFDLSGGIGLTGINLNSNNSNVLENRTATAITASLGTVFKFNRWANIGVFLGWDWLGAKDRAVNWKYNGDMWIGLGINISFNSIKAEEDANVKERSNHAESKKGTTSKKKK